MMTDSFYMVLPSNASLQTFPGDDAFKRTLESEVVESHPSNDLYPPNMDP